MSLSDTAEYWADVKSHFRNRGNEMVFHDPGFICDNPKREFHGMAEYIEDVNCYRCRRNFKANGTQLPSMKCTCGKMMVFRINKTTKKEFLGCSNYPKCKNTKSISE